MISRREFIGKLILGVTALPLIRVLPETPPQVIPVILETPVLYGTSVGAITRCTYSFWRNRPGYVEP